MIKAVIFDFDGVLVDSHGIINNLFTKIANEKLNLKISVEEFAQYPGMRFEQRLKKLAKEKKLNIPDSEIDKITKFGRQEYLLNSISYVGLFPGIMELLDELRKNNIKLAIGTNGSRNNVEKLLKNFQIIDYFQSIITYDDIEYGKPNPDMFLKIASQLKLNPNECIVIEDAIEGITGAHAAGMKTIGVTTTSTEEELRDAEIVVKTIKDINLCLLNRVQRCGSPFSRAHKLPK